MITSSTYRLKIIFINSILGFLKAGKIFNRKINRVRNLRYSVNSSYFLGR